MGGVSRIRPRDPQFGSSSALQCCLRGAGARKRRPAPRGLRARAQPIPAETVQLRGASRPAILR
eukprot:15435635-Alexandrium_andersonii.AAC.1